MYARRHDSAPPNGLTGQMLFSLLHANPIEQSPNQLPQKLPILKYTRHRIEILSDVIYIHQPMLSAKCYCFAVAKTNAAISLERVANAQLLCLQAERRRQRRRLFHGRITDRALSSRTLVKYCHVTASNSHSYANVACELTTLISNSI